MEDPQDAAENTPTMLWSRRADVVASISDTRELRYSLPITS